MMSRTLHLLALLSCVLLETIAINRTDFFGEQTSLMQLELVTNDDDSSNEITLSVPYPFFDKPMSTLYVNNNGAITFLTQAIMYNATEFPRNKYRLIAQFWGDVDTRETGKVWYMETTDQALLDKATEYIHQGFVLRQEFRPTHLFIATWDGVGYYERRSDKTNTFQTIMATDSIDLYVIFLYADIQWTTGNSNMGVNGLGGIPAQVGFNAGDGKNFYSVPGSRTDDIVNIDKQTNIGVPGAWVFHVSGSTVKSGGCMETGSKITLVPSHGSILGGEMVSVTGPCFNANSQIKCEFDSVVKSAIFVSAKEVLCISPQLRRSGRLNFRLLIDGHAVSRERFTSIPIENAYQVSVTTPTGRVHFTANDTIELHWSTESIFPQNSSSEIQVNISMYGLNLQDGEWELIHKFVSNSDNDGQEIVRIPRDLNRSLEILPVIFQVATSTDPISTVSSDSVYSKLVRSGQSAGWWSSQYYYFNPVVAMRTSYHLCQSWYEGEGSTGAPLTDGLNKCPPQESQARAINSGLMEIDYTSFFGSVSYKRQWMESFHPGTSTCFTGKLQSTVSSSSQQCCYDDAGRLIIGAPGGGSINKVALATSRVSHFLEDVRPYLLCCTGYAPNCNKYYERRPSDDGSRYHQPLPAWIFGDPHLVTLDGHNYTFNGKGEFTLIQTPNNIFTLQGRFQQFNNVTATVLTAIAAVEQYSDKVMIAQSRRGVDAYVNEARIDLSMVRQQEFRNVTIFRGNDSNSLSVAFHGGELLTARAENGFLSAFAVVLPELFRGTTQGLLGNYDGNSANDFKSSTGGNPLSTSDSLDRIHKLFGSSWILNAESDSLFSYRPYESFVKVRDPTFTPTFDINPEPANVSPCNGDPFCEYDITITGDREVGMATLSAVADIQEAVEKSYPVVCNPPCEKGACIANNTCRCSVGYDGTHCNLVPNIRSCDLNPCASGERCAIVGGSYICTPNCGQTPLSPFCNFISSNGPCNMNHCNNHGVCRPNSSAMYGFECLCPPGYTGRLCDLKDNPCATHPCQNGGACTVINNNFACNCSEGYSGDRCENAGVNVTMIVIIVTVIVGGVFVILIVLVIIILAAIASTKRRKKNTLQGMEQAGNKGGTLKSTGTGESVHPEQNGTVSRANYVNTELPRPSSTNPYVIHNRGQYSQNHNSDQQQQQQHVGQENYPPTQGDSQSDTYPPQTPKGHDATPPPPYPADGQAWQQSNSNQNNSRIPRVTQMSRVQSDSRLSSVTNQRLTSFSDSNCSRSSTTSPTNDKESLEKLESLHIIKQSMSNRPLLTPSPCGPESGPHSQSHQGLPLRSTASTPSGPVCNAMKQNTVSRNWNSQQFSMSANHIPVRRHSSTSSYVTTLRNGIDGREIETMV